MGSIYILRGCDMEIISLTDEYKEKVERIVVESYSGMKIAVLFLSSEKWSTDYS